MDTTDVLAEIDHVMSRLGKIHDSLMSELQLFSTAQALDWIRSDQWPLAAEPETIVNPDDPSMKEQRGEGILELMIQEEIAGKKFLDYGCGEGYVSTFAATKGATAVGFDRVEQNWGVHQKAKDLHFTTDFDDVADRGPYDLVLVYDVVDHIQGITPYEAYAQFASVMKPGAMAYVLHHPWMSRHAIHQYHDLNKAFIHLALNQDELLEATKGMKHTIPCFQAQAPMLFYDSLIKHSGLVVVNRTDTRENVENFFRPGHNKPDIGQRIIDNTKMGFFPEFQMSLQFVEYILQKPEEAAA